MTATVIADSISYGCPRLTTIEVDIHRFMLPELNTHRVLSKSSASSRAIPLSKQLVKPTAFPVEWPAEQPGMQGGEQIEVFAEADTIWHEAHRKAAMYARELGDLGVHKSICNRLLEPFQMHTVLLTGTAWENFFALRCNPLAQPEIRAAAEAIRLAYDASTPVHLEIGDWHLPYLSDEEKADMPPVEARKVSAARCARLSYLTQNGVRDYAQDIQLYERLSTARPMHAVPFEHVARPASRNQHWVDVSGDFSILLPRYGNLLGWRQFRFDIEAEMPYQSFS